MSILTEYQRLVAERNAIISENRSRRMRRNKLPPLPVPPKPARPQVPVAYDADGEYVGRLNSPDECPPDCTIRWEDAAY